MKVLHFNHHDVGGSAVLMLRLHDQLRARGVNSEVRYRSGDISDPAAKKMEFTTTSIERWIERASHSAENRLLRRDAGSYFSRMQTFHPTELKASDHDADLVHLHWVGRWLDIKSFLKSVPSQIPVIWTIHDMSPLAGGCISDIGCSQWENQCSVCPLLKFPLDRILAKRELKRRREIMTKRRVTAVANSEYTRGMIEKSFLFEHQSSVPTIHPGIQATQFEAIEKPIAKKKLGIPRDRFVVGFGAASVTDEIKGCDHFVRVVNHLNQMTDQLHVLIFGDGSPADSIDAPLMELGLLSSKQQQSVAYSAMDAFVVASKMETFGQVASEAQACGTPTYAFEVGGLADAIDKGRTGGLVPFGNCQEMAQLILSDRESGRLSAMSQRCRAWIVDKFSMSKSVDAYLQVYHRALQHSAGVAINAE